MPPCITPNARARNPCGRASTNSPFNVGSKPATAKPDTMAISATTGAGGAARAGTRASGATTASGRISARRRSGGTKRPISRPPRMKPTGPAAMIMPWAMPRESGSGLVCPAHAAARPSGTIANKVIEKTMTATRRSRWSPKTTRNPSPVSRNRCLRCAEVRAGGRGRTPRAISAAEIPNVTASTAMASRGLNATAVAAPAR